jgi:hypothetical protein
MPAPDSHERVTGDRVESGDSAAERRDQLGAALTRTVTPELDDESTV